ncbi:MULTISPECIES: ECF transporter S component [unclassified Streptococcus]|uniref:ECF transporter S component n=1 Tax=unclassified Streptococcus TaxID=2608887 RepID=UPI001072B9FE|nr:MULTISPECIES: ECF transporter S component [unclassified Streptococcus]MBF0787941.1 ECF transporter S component [Streptococcus sp. 19428wC2_LYSM12]MCQ9211306.1 ECF transporter S component [Streptococcus sp. B01]MCQ9214618.1 ECF transporter S component [Streptococcus sp. O1]TFV05059.1 ECF transporter S component [Streptococcus sp. LYSM12]
MKIKQTQKIVLLSILTALTIVLGYLHVSTLTGIITFLDVGIFFTAFYLGSKEGAIVGGLSGLLLDLLLGYPQWAFFSLVFHGLQGYAAGWSGKKRFVGLVLASLAMVGGYFVASMKMYHLAGALDGLMGNLIQNTVGMVLGSILANAMTSVRKEAI